MVLTKLFKEFISSEKAGGLILLACTTLSLLLANSSLQESYQHIWQYQVLSHPLEYWINDGLMAIFFLLVGLELEREMYSGELSNLRNALLPIAAALGGMIIPAIIHSCLNAGTPTSAGAGIPMATDIAFALGVLSLLGKRVPASLKIFLTALAVIDDLGAIVVIAIFYTHTIIWLNLLIALGIYLVLIALNKLKVFTLWPYLLRGIAMWFFMLHSGVQATITGVLLAFVVPYGDRTEKSPSYRLQHFLHIPVAYIIIPLFALANTAIVINTHWTSIFTHRNELGIMGGLILGKPIGILLFSWLSVTIGFCSLPLGIKWKHILGVGMLGGIGFTMSIFITLLAFDNTEITNLSKLAILMASLISGTIGWIWLKWSFKKSTLTKKK